MRNDAKSEPINVDELNKVIDAKSKLINVAGIKTITDEAVSVYNQDNIKAVAHFDANMAYTYELAVPLKYLDLSNNGNDAFSYNIKVNEPDVVNLLPNGKLPPPQVVLGPPPPPMPVTSLSPTDFWGEYKLAK